MTIGKFARYFVQIAAVATLLAFAPADRAMADTFQERMLATTDVNTARGFYLFVRNMHAGAQRQLNGEENSDKPDPAAIAMWRRTVAAWQQLEDDARRNFAAALTAHIIDVALTEQEPEKPQVAKPKPKPKPTRTTRRPRPSDEGEEPAAPAEAPAAAHNPAASDVVGNVLGTAIGIGIGSAIRGGHGGGGGGGGRRTPSTGGGGCPGGKC